ncbi:MAG: patatin-like phospholipase family protein [Clostridia bacterium]|nr:patatin-like phospholipase family protein [Clostridia bacterium]
MEKYGLVLAGGGGKGAYQIGAWRALSEMGITFNAIVGVSIGSINGAMIAAGNYEKAVEFWNSISVDKGVRISEDLPDPENLFSKKNWGTLFKEFLKKGGIDASPAQDFVSQYIDEKKVRESLIEFGVIAVPLTQGVTKREIFIYDIPEGELVDYLLASANIPFAQNIGPEGEKYLDGGAYDNIPVKTLKKRGYNKLIVVDISNIKGVAHNLDIFNSQIVYIRPYDLDDLGATFDFDAATIEKRNQLGYLDTKKAFSQLSGNIYYFMPSIFRSMVIKYGADTILQLEELAHELKVPKAEIYTADGFILTVKAAYMTALEIEKEKEREREEKEAQKQAQKNKGRGRLSEIIKEQEKERAENNEKENDSFLRSALKKRFGQKNPFEDFPEAVALLDNYIL